MNNVNDVCFVLAEANFEYNLKERFIAKLEEKLRNSPYMGTELEHYGRLCSDYAGRTNELSSIDLLRFCDFYVVDVADDNEYPGVDLIIDGLLFDCKSAKLKHSKKVRQCGQYTLNPVSIYKDRDVFILGSGLQPDQLVMVTVLPKQEDLAGFKRVKNDSSGKVGYGNIELSTYPKNKWLKHGGSAYDAMLMVANITGNSKAKARIAQLNFEGFDFDRYYIDRIVHHAETFPAPDKEEDSIYGLARQLDSKMSGEAFEAALLLILIALGYNARAAIGDEQGTHGDILVTLHNGVEVWLELKFGTQDERVGFYNIKTAAEFDYLVGIHIEKGIRRFYIIPKDITRKRSSDGGLTGISKGRHDGENQVEIKGSSIESPTHDLYKYKYNLRDGLEKLDRILKGNT